MANESNQNILELLGLLTPPLQDEGGSTPPEILEYLRNYGTGNMNTKDPNRLMQPVSSGNVQATHWTQALAHVMDAYNRQRMLGQHNQLLMQNRRQGVTPPAGPNAPPPPQVQPPRVQPPNNQPPNNQTPPSTFDLGGITQPGFHIDNPQDLFNVNPNGAPDVGGADQMADVNNAGLTGMGGMLGQVANTMRGQSYFDPNARVPPNRPDDPANDRINWWQLPTGDSNTPPPTDNIITGSNPDRQPPSEETPPTRQPPGSLETPPGITLEDTGRRHIDGMPVFRQEDYNLLATFPRTQPFRSGMSQEQQLALLHFPPDQRKAIEDSHALQYTPQFTDVLGGRRWIIPATQETGFIPTPMISQIRTPSGLQLQSVTMFDRNGRRQTFVLDPSDNPPPNSQILPGNEQPPGQDLPGSEQPASRRIAGQFGQRAEDELVGQTARQETARQYSQGQAQVVQEAVNRSAPANQVLQITEHIQNLLNTPGANQRLTGRLAEPWMQAVRDVNAMFVSAGRAAPLNPNQVTIGELLDKLGILLAAPASHQLTNRPTQFDFQSFIRTNPNLVTSPDGARMMVSIIRGFAERDRAIAEYAGRFQQERGPTGDSRGFIEGLHRVYDQHMSNIGRMMVDNGLPLDRGFRLDGYEYIGSRTDNPRDRTLWRPINRGNQQ